MEKSEKLWETLLVEIQRLRSHSDNIKTKPQCDSFVTIVAQAYLNPIYISWDIETFSESRVSVRKRLPSPQLGHIDVPATVVDKRGRIIIWYLSGCVVSDEQIKLLTATEFIIPQMQNNVKEPNGVKCVNWRVNRKTFVDLKSSRSLRSLPHGVETYSAAWFAQGQTSHKKQLKPSRSLNSRAAKLWLKSSASTQAKLNDILSLIHPKLYSHGMKALAKSRKMPLTRGAAKRWTSAFTGIAVMSNRRSIAHRDRNGAPAWYDLLVSLGTYETASLDFPELGLSLAYPPGTAVALCGNILIHQVNAWGSGDRVCYAQFFRKAVLRRLDAEWVGWSTQSKYEENPSI